MEIMAYLDFGRVLSPLSTQFIQVSDELSVLFLQAFHSIDVVSETIVQALQVTVSLPGPPSPP